MRTMLCIALFALSAGLHAGDILVADFEGDDYGSWTTTGEAFGKGPARGTLPNQLPVSGFEGKGLVNSYRGGDGTQGTLTSPEFRIERKYFNFLVGGGAHAGETCLNLLVGGKVVRTATGAEDERLDWRTWDVSDLAGKTARIEIVDRNSGGWGHINADQILQSDERRAEEISTAELYAETYRPQFHFTPARNWTNDPNGLVWYAGEYHLFFQHNPLGTGWGNMTWGHAVSRDLVRWVQMPNAIERDELGTIFSGSAVVDHANTAGLESGAEKTIVAIYTAAGGTSPESQGKPFTQCIAWSNDRGRTWKKYEKNPVLPHIVGSNRDPKVVWHEPSRRWIMALFKDGSVFGFFSSPDLKTWTHLHDIDVPGCGECPDFFEMSVDGDPSKKVWVWTAANGNYLVGSFDGKKFAPQTGPHRADHGKNYYAVQTYSDIPPSDGRRIQIAWMNGGRYPGMPFNQQMSFPCVLTLRTYPEGIRMCRYPVREIETLREKKHEVRDAGLEPGTSPLRIAEGELLDILAEIDVGAASDVGIRARGEEVRYSVKEKKLSCLGASADMEPVGGKIRLRILVDRTSIEVFGQDGKVSLTSCFLARARERSVEAFAVGGAARIVSCQAWTLRSAWTDEARRSAERLAR